MKNIRFTLLLLPLFSSILAQEIKKDSLQPIQMHEVIVIGKKAQIANKQAKTLTSIDDYLQKSPKVDMIKRGAYAWEPMINSMPTERTLITIDGMRIFGACTDKMDPITSYVEVSNLSEATISSGQEGACYGSTIGGSIDLKTNRNTFRNQEWNGSVSTGYETNNKLEILASAINYADSLVYIDVDFIYRNAENYTAGNDKEVRFSQFKKRNFSATSGFKLGKNKLIESSLIYDKATDVGYPALPMDVSIAEATIAALQFEYVPLASAITNWETKVYFNTIMHKMDDTKRPFVPVHMDMPGWSKTYGYYSKIKAKKENHHFLINFNSFYNKSRAEMTMYPENPDENLMFMLTWPDVSTFYNGLFLEDQYHFNCHSSLKFTMAMGSHSNKVASELGLNSLQIFYPEMAAQKNRFLKSASSNYNHTKQSLGYGFGIAYGERAPSVTEAYGFYLFNSFENFDNIGNPTLKNEKSFEGNAYLTLKKEKTNLKIATSYFYVVDYIVGRVDENLVPMTIGATGVKIYTALDNATIFNVSFTADYSFSKQLKWNTLWVYSRGKDNEQVNLPFMSPLRYSSSLQYAKDKISAEIILQGNANQTDFSPTYGEDETPDYAVINMSFGYKFNLYTNKVDTKFGVENIFDTYYSTYADWNNIPRQGRNLFVNFSVAF